MRQRQQPSFEYERINNYFPPHPPLPWGWIDNEARDRFFKPVQQKWKRLLNSQRIRETTCTRFIADHAGYFLCNHASFFALSEIRLGSEFVIDLAVPYDRASLGLLYTLIEIEPPHQAPFKKNGDKSARLSHAIDQVENWRRWLRRHARMARELFPYWYEHQEPQFQFEIIIGTRENTRDWLERRNEISNDYRISIRSHDYLTDCLGEGRFMFNEDPTIGGAEERGVSLIVKNAMGNPFFKAWSDSEWKRVRNEMSATGHFFVWNSDVIIKNRNYNSLFKPFVRYCERRQNKFSPDIKALYQSWKNHWPISPL
jgi:hypothetical protein